MTDYALPDRITLGPFPVDVVVGRAAIDRQAVAARCDLLGAWVGPELTLYLAPDQPIALERETVLHELVHALLELTGAGAHDDAPIGAHEELVVRMLSPALLALLRSNPQLVAYLTAP